MKDIILATAFFLGYGLITGAIIGYASCNIVYHPKSNPLIGWTKIIGVLIICLVFLPGRESLVNSFFGLQGYEVNLGNWMIIVSLVFSIWFTFRSSRAKKVGAR